MLPGRKVKRPQALNPRLALRLACSPEPTLRVHHAQGSLDIILREVDCMTLSLHQANDIIHQGTVYVTRNANETALKQECHIDTPVLQVGNEDVVYCRGDTIHLGSCTHAVPDDSHRSLNR